MENQKKERDFASHCGCFSFQKRDCDWDQTGREAQMTAQLSHYRGKQSPGYLQIVYAQLIGFMKNKNYIKSLFKKKFTFMNKYSLGYSQSSGKGRIEVTFAKISQQCINELGYKWTRDLLQP